MKSLRLRIVIESPFTQMPDDYWRRFFSERQGKGRRGSRFGRFAHFGGSMGRKIAPP
jgi:hypothetical protein